MSVDMVRVVKLTPPGRPASHAFTWIGPTASDAAAKTAAQAAMLEAWRVVRMAEGRTGDRYPPDWADSKAEVGTLPEGHPRHEVWKIGRRLYGDPGPQKPIPGHSGKSDFARATVTAIILTQWPIMESLKAGESVFASFTINKEMTRNHQAIGVNASVGRQGARWRNIELQPEARRALLAVCAHSCALRGAQATHISDFVEVSAPASATLAAISRADAREAAGLAKIAAAAMLRRIGALQSADAIEDAP